MEAGVAGSVVVARRRTDGAIDGGDGLQCWEAGAGVFHVTHLVRRRDVGSGKSEEVEEKLSKYALRTPPIGGYNRRPATAADHQEQGGRI